MTERQIEHKLCAEVKKFGGKCIKFVPTFAVGFPDRIVLLPDGQVHFIELKNSDNGNRSKVSPMQRNWLEWLTNNGHDARVIRTVADLKDFIAQI